MNGIRRYRGCDGTYTRASEGTLPNTVVSTRQPRSKRTVSQERLEELLEIDLYERYRADRERLLVPAFALVAAGAATVGLFIGFFLGRNDNTTSVATVGTAAVAPADATQALGAPETEEIVVDAAAVGTTVPATTVPATTAPAATFLSATTVPPPTTNAPTTTIEILPPPEPLASFTGTRPWVGSVTVEDDVPAIAVVEVGSGRSMVRSLAAGGIEIERFFDGTGPSAGVYVVNFGDGPLRHLHVETRSEYTLTLLPLEAARPVLIDDVSGSGNEVLRLAAEGERVQFSAIDGGQLTVWTIGDGEPEQAATARSGDVITLPEGDAFLEIRSADDWSLE